MKKALALLLILVLTAGILAGCGAKEQAAKDTLTIMGMIKTEDMNPVVGSIGRDPNLIESIFGSMAKFDSSGTIVPGMVSWTLAEDGLTKNFTIKDGIKFHDGSDLTADDVIFTFEKMMEDEIMVYSMGRFTWEKTGDMTFSMTPNSPLTDPAQFMTTVYIVPSESYDPETFRKAPIGAGAYKVSTVEADGTVRLEAFGDYWGDKPYFKNLVIKAPLEASAAVIALQNGEVDILWNVAAGQLPLVREDSKLELIEAPGFGATGVWFYKDLKDDINLKLAISYAIDRDKLVKIARDGAAVVSTDLISSRTLGELAGSVKMPGYDPDKAKEYLAKSDYKSGDVIPLTVNSADAAAAQCIMEDLKAIGITIEITTMDAGSLLQEINNKNVTMSITTNGASVATTGGLLRNFTSANDEDILLSSEYDDTVNQALSELDSAKRNELYKRALEIQAELVNVAPLYEATSNICFVKGIDGLNGYLAASGLLYPETLRMK